MNSAYHIPTLYETELTIGLSLKRVKKIKTLIPASKFGMFSRSLALTENLIINLGGGVVTDLGGFVASTFKRGFHYSTLTVYGRCFVGGKKRVDLGNIKKSNWCFQPAGDGTRRYTISSVASKRNAFWSS
jgi:3-dehydroquinate synthase